MGNKIRYRKPDTAARSWGVRGVNSAFVMCISSKQIPRMNVIVTEL